MKYCEYCGDHENDIEESIWTCACIRGRKTYDIDRALSEIEDVLRENGFAAYNPSRVVKDARRDNNT